MKNVFLKDHTTFKIGGRAKYFEPVENISQLKEAVSFARKKNIPIFILGGGSNVLFSDDGFDGMIIKLNNKESKIKREKIISGAGAPLGKLVGLASKNSLAGFEWAAGIPGTIGGAVFGNAGALGKEIKDIVKSVRVLEIRNLKEKIFNYDRCDFSYRDSFFKKKKGCFIIIELALELEKGGKKEIKNKIDKNILYKKNHQPLNFPSAGSIFKNINLAENLLEKFSEFEKFKEIKKIPASYLIGRCGLKGKKIGGAKISEKQPNFILNVGGARAEDVLILINTIKQKVRDKFNIQLEEEIIYIN